MPRARLTSGIELEFETRGDPKHPTLLLVCGYTSQINGWDPGLVNQLVEQELHVVCFDNRDVGLSTKLTDHVEPMKVFKAMQAGEPTPDVPYTLSDMGNDAIGLLDYFGVERAHIAGTSMGGMIVQTMAIEHPTRVASLTSVMSTTGDAEFGRSSKEARDALLMPPPTDRDAFIAASVNAAVWCSKRYLDLEGMQRRAAFNFDRSFFPEGATRQLAAIYASGDRSAGLARLDVSTLVIHGRDDTLISPSGGERTAELIPGSKLLMLSDMGHDLPEQLWPVIADAIGSHIRLALG
jgi:pimeloyl-ACP methyl ester carboxylesterase